MVHYQVEPGLSPDEFIDVLVRSTLAERRPIGDRAKIERMLAEADIIVAARDGGRLVGVARALSDFSFCTYLADLAVDEAFQRQGIGRALLEKTHQTAGLDTTLILLAAPRAETYYAHIGLTRHSSAWIIRSS